MCYGECAIKDVWIIGSDLKPVDKVADALVSVVDLNGSDERHRQMREETSSRSWLEETRSGGHTMDDVSWTGTRPPYKISNVLMLYAV